MDRYRKIEKLGEGSYGIVYKAQCKGFFLSGGGSSNSSNSNNSNTAINNSTSNINNAEGQIVALKRIRLTSGEEGIPATAIREISLLRELKHPNIVRLLDILHTENKLTLVFEYLDNDLRKYMDSQNPSLDSSTYLDLVKGFVYQLLQGISHCHQEMVVHRDLKPQNLLISRRGELKIADFGLARSIGSPLTILSTDVVTLWYRSPDIILGNTTYGTSVDMWAIGCIIGELINREPLFQGKDKVDQLMAITKVLGRPTMSSWPSFSSLQGIKDDDGNVLLEAKEGIFLSAPSGSSLATKVPAIDSEGLDLLSQLLRYAPEQRIASKEAIAHPWFDGVRDRYTFMYNKH